VSRGTQDLLSGSQSFAYRSFTFFARTFQFSSARFPTLNESPTTPISEEIGLGSSLFARRYWGNRVFFFLFLRVLRCFSSPACLLRVYVFNTGYLDMTPDGLPHSGIHGSMPACGSPWHFAANRALLRLLAPRHPPYALCILTFIAFLFMSM
jgi:hypothetical protein